MKVSSIVTFLLISIYSISIAEKVEGKQIVRKGLCEQINNAKNPITAYILKLIHEIQSHMHDGIPAMGIPPLDPLRLPNSDFNVKESKYTAKGQLKDVVVSNLATFNVTDIASNIFSRSVNVSLEIPAFYIHGIYNLNGKLLKIFPIYGKGPFMLKPTGITCKLFIVIGMHEGKLGVSSFDYKMDMKDVYVKFDGIFGGGGFGDIVNTIINSLGVKLFHIIEPKLHKEIETILIDDINRIFKGATMFGLLSIPDSCNY